MPTFARPRACAPDLVELKVEAHRQPATVVQPGTEFVLGRTDRPEHRDLGSGVDRHDPFVRIVTLGEERVSKRLLLPFRVVRREVSPR